MELGCEKLTDCTWEVENLRLFSFCWTEDKGVEDSDNLPTFDLGKKMQHYHLNTMIHLL